MLNMMILAQTVVELSRGQVRHSVKSDSQAKFDFEGHGQSKPKSKEILSNAFCIFWV